MSRVCEVCGKGPVVGHTISHSHIRAKRRWFPNLHTVKVSKNGATSKVKVCAKCLKANKVKVVA